MREPEAFSLTPSEPPNGTYSDRRFAYAKFCLSCKTRAASHPLSGCPYPEHEAQFERARMMKKSPRIRFKSKNGMGLYERDGKYGKPVCRSCRKALNCLPLPSCSLEGHREYYEKAREKLRNIHWKVKIAVIKMLGRECVGCGITDIRILQVNHRGSEGHVLWNRSSTKFFKWIAKGKLPLQAYDLRCANCNVL